MKIDVLSLKKEEIINQNRHQFIYGIPKDQRQAFIEELERENPVTANTYSPMAICLDEYGLANNIPFYPYHDKLKLCNMSRKYLNLSIAYNIMSRVGTITEELTKEDIDKFLSSIHSQCGIASTSSIDELTTTFKLSRQSIADHYCTYVSARDEVVNSDMPDIDLSMYVPLVKRLLNNKAYFAILVNNNINISNLSKQAINSIISTRSNSNLSMKVITDAFSWNTMQTLDDKQIEPNHDYSEVELDIKKKIYMIKHSRKRI